MSYTQPVELHIIKQPSECLLWAQDLKIAQILEIGNVQILLYLCKKDEARHSELSDLFKSRGTLRLILVQLEEEGLIQRRAVTVPKPIQSFYSLTEKGKAIAKELEHIKRFL